MLEINDVVSCRVVSCRVVSCRVVSCRIVLYCMIVTRIPSQTGRMKIMIITDVGSLRNLHDPGSLAEYIRGVSVNRRCKESIVYIFFILKPPCSMMLLCSPLPR